MKEAYVIGVDFGTDSVRSVIVNAGNGDEVASDVFYYRRWQDRLGCDPAHNQFRQHPQDYIDGLESTIRACVKSAGLSVAEQIRALSVDTTGSTPVAVDQRGVPLALHSAFENNPNAMFVLWKDHTAIQEATEINHHAEKFATNYLQYVGGIYSSEWFWAKLLHVLRNDEAVRKACYSWVEHCDWIPFLLTGGTNVHDLRRGVCAAGHKALFSPAFGGLPPEDFFASLDPLLSGFRSRLFSNTYTADQPAGMISPAWAQRLNLPATVVVGIGAFDAHMGAVGGQIEPYHLSKVMGTSTCDMLVVPRAEIKDTLVNGICGQVDGSVIPGMMGLEAGQSAFGDTYAWFRDLLAWPMQHLLHDQPSVRDATIDRLIPLLTEHAARLPLEAGDEIALDWLNGRRTPDANQELQAAIGRLKLGSDAPRVFRALVESTCFGAKAIVERFNEQGVPVKGLIGLGGVARKSPYIMQMMADVMNMPIRIHRSEQTCAAGAAMFAATAAGQYNKVEDAMQSMGRGFDKTFVPDAAKVDYYRRRFDVYRQLGNLISQL
ncbi:MAG: ribulokinase [Cyclobacteriaceae bacterium]|nr:ribulokinase [Cyclobacteriaceae bacterium]